MKRYFTEKDHDKLIYFQMPKMLVYADKYKNLSNDAKVLYTVCLDLIKLSMENHGRYDEQGNIQIWKDEKGFFISLSVKTICQILNCGRDKAIKLKKELEKYELIEQKRIGVQRANLLYVLQLDYTEEDIYKVNNKHEEILKQEGINPSGSIEVGKSDFKKSEKPTSRSRENRLQEVGKTDPINNKSIKNDLIKNKNTKNLSIKESDIQNLNLPKIIQKQLIKKIDRLIADQIDIDEIELLYHAVKDQVNQYQFAQALLTVLEKTKGGIRNITNLLLTAIKNNFELSEISETNKVAQNENSLPEYMLNKEKHKLTDDPVEFEKKKQEIEMMIKEFSSHENKSEPINLDDFEIKKKELEERLRKYGN